MLLGGYRGAELTCQQTMSPTNLSVFQRTEQTMYARQRPVDKSKCIICQPDAEEPLTPLTDKGLRSVMNSCVARKTELNVTAGSVDSIPYVTHSTCRKRFTDLRKVQQSAFDTDVSVPMKRLHSGSDLFDWKRMCFLCKMPADGDSA